MLISERGVPSGLRTLLLKSSPMSSEILVNASESVSAEMSTFFSPPPLFKTDGIVNFMVASLAHHGRNFCHIGLNYLRF